jgi:hypothetical protein
MAQKVSVQLLDDLDGGEATETVVFALNGQSYEIDLSEGHAGELRAVLAPYAEAGRKQGGTRRAQRRIAVPTGDRPNPSEVRTWAAAQGIEVAARGRVPEDVVAKFQAAKGR